MDYSKEIKSILESSDLLAVLDKFKLDRDQFCSAVRTNGGATNICCSNGSFLFVYLEQTASLLTLSFDRLCKSDDKSFIDSFQRLNINAAPIGKFKKLQINSNGTFILLVYDKSLTVVQLPTRYGKYGQYEGGKSNIICKSIKFNLGSRNRISVIDAGWHPKLDDDLIVCLTSLNNLIYYQVSNPNVALKEYLFSNLNLHSISATDLNTNSTIKNGESKFLYVEIGSRFEYDDKYAYPVFVLKSNGQVDCLIEFENSKKFKYIGNLTIVPYCMDYEENQVVSFLCLPKHPNCIALMLRSGLIYHCIFVPNSKISRIESVTFTEDGNEDLNSEALLFVYESIKLDEGGDFNSVKLLRDYSNSSRYFAIHSAGVHSIYLPWLDNLQIIYEKHKNLNMNEFDETEYCELGHLISTRPSIDKESSVSICGATVLFNFAKSDRVLIVLNSQAKFVCINTEIAAQNQKLKQAEDLETKSELNESSSLSDNSNQFTDFIIGILKREADMPVIKADGVNGSDEELSSVVTNSINLIKAEYIERQKKVIIEFQKRCKILKQQESLQNETIQDLNGKLSECAHKKSNLKGLLDKFSQKQELVEKRLENVLNKLLQMRQVPMTQSELSTFNELKSINTACRDFEEKTLEAKALISRLDMTQGQRVELNLEEQETAQMKSLIKNHSEKIKELVQKVELMKQIVRK